MKTNKVQWNKPELLVLTRSNPEEAVLVGCKGAPVNVGGPAGTGNNCKENSGSGLPCNQPAMS